MNNNNESQKVELLKEIKNAISNEATIFSGYEQHVSSKYTSNPHFYSDRLKITLNTTSN